MLNVKLELLCNVNRLGQRIELVVGLFKLRRLMAPSGSAASRLDPVSAASANEGTYHDGLIQVAVQKDEADTASVGIEDMRIQPRNNLNS